MPERTRPIHKGVRLIEQEMDLVHQKMVQLDTQNFGSYARKMLMYF